MNQQAILALVEKSSLKAQPPQFKVGDEVDVHTRILEGEKERIQIFNGTVIARSGAGSREMFTVRRIVQGEGVERKFPLNSPKIANIIVKRSSVVRRAKLYFLRDRVGKAVKLRERRDEQQTTTPEKRRAAKPAGVKKKSSKQPVAAGK
jgi:large subunit ribosomal protein L19